MTLPSPLPIREQIETPVQKKYFNLQLFTRVADEYDLATRAMSLGQDARWKRRLLALLPCHATAPVRGSRLRHG